MRANPEDAGCWIDGHWGHYGVQRLIEIATMYGWEDVEATELAAQYPDVDPDKYYDMGDDAEEWMNENVAPEGYSFGWRDGEFFLEKDEDEE